MKKKELVVVAMSGGVDSSVAAALLKEKGYEVIGITMCFNIPESLGDKPSCCGLAGIEDARRVCQKLGIKHYVLNLEKDFYKQVIQDFCQQYLTAMTPNPCVRCNQYIKFDILLKKAISLGAKFMATGHYAKIVTSHKSQVTSLEYLLKKAKDRKKDQSYFLYQLTQKQLKYILFPLGDYTKDKVRKIAAKFSLPVADKADSQEICFLPKNNYRDFLRQYAKDKIKPGKIVDTLGNVLGEHEGVPFYTIGQRQGLRIAKGYPLYITKIERKSNRIIVGNKTDACKRSFLLKNTHFINEPIKKKVEIKVRIRYNHKESPAYFMPSDGKAKIVFNKPQFAVTPGQSAVFYQKDTILGGGLIDKVIN